MFVNYDPINGEILGFYDQSIHDEIPEPNIEIDFRTWQFLLEHPSEYIIEPVSKEMIKKPNEHFIWNGTSWDVDFEKIKEDKIQEIAHARYNEEISGINVGGFNINTDRESQSLITAAAFSALQDPSYTCRWKTKDGFVTLDANTIIQMATAVRNHIQNCFNKEDQLLTEIENATTVEELNNITW